MKNNILSDDKENIFKNEWSSEKHALNYLNKANEIPHRSEGEYVLFYHIPNCTIPISINIKTTFFLLFIFDKCL